MSITHKIDKDALIIIIAGFVLAGSGVWKFFEEEKARSYNVVLSVQNNETSAASESQTSVTASAVTAETVTVDESENLYIDINSASSEELMKLRGVGEHIAQEIISYRESHGGFRNIEELMNVAGIGEAVFEGLWQQVYVVDPVYDEPIEPDTEQYEEVTEEIAEPIAEIGLTLEAAAPININTADVELLMLLPHVDETEADEIIKLREGIGGFQSLYELLYVESLTTQEVAEIFEYITIE